MTADAQGLVQGTLLAEALDNAGICVVVFDPDGHYLAVNQAALDLLGYTRDEFLALRPGDLLPPGGGPAEELLAELRASSRIERTTAVVRKDGSLVEVRYTSVASRMANLDVFVSLAERVAAPGDGAAR